MLWTDLQRSIGPPMTPPILVPIVDDSTMKHSGQCCVSGSYMSAIRPSVTLPPAVERPPYHCQFLSNTKSVLTPKKKTTHQRPTNNNGAKIRCHGARNLPDIDQKHAQLQNRPATKLLTPWCPKLASKRVEDEIYHLSHASGLRADAEMLGDGVDSTGVHGCVEVHGYLDAGD